VTSGTSFGNLLREILLAIGMIVLLIGGLYAHTGTMPPLVVVESSSMIHSEQGEIGSIDAGDLILVQETSFENIVTFAEATDVTNRNFGYETHGMEGDVIIFKKGGSDVSTPIIHRAILRVVANDTSIPDRDAFSSQEASDSIACPDGGVFDERTYAEDGMLGACVFTWDVPGTHIVNSEVINISFDGEHAGYYDCKRPTHAGIESYLEVSDWSPEQAGFLTLGDNNKCSADQGNDAVRYSTGLTSPTGGVIDAVQDDWIVGKAGGEIPWLGVVKLMVSSGNSPGTDFVPRTSFMMLFGVIGLILVTPSIVDPLLGRIMQGSPEFDEAKHEKAMNRIVEALQEEE
tara:strand:+ start:276 stop:1310 length:1035 start_codon:yes stop_codon:yes gene_type:complete